MLNNKGPNMEPWGTPLAIDGIAILLPIKKLIAAI